MHARRSGKSHVVVARKRILAEKRVHEEQQRDQVTDSSSDTLPQSTGTSSQTSPVDVFRLLPDDVVVRLTGFLDAASLLQLRTVNQTFCRVCDWEAQCQALWRDKIHVCPEARTQVNRHEAYRMSLADAKARNHLHREELVYCPVTGTGTIWSFRFKESAGADWTRADPWYNGGNPRQFVFFENGLVQQYTPRPDASSTTESISAGLAHPDFQQQQRSFATAAARPAAVASATITDPPVPMTWRFLTRPMDLPTRPPGSYIRMSVNGRDVPTYAVRRSPTCNWGFVMESCWGLYASFDLPARRRDEDKIDANDREGAEKKRKRRTILRRTEEGNILRILDYEDDSDSEGSPDASQPDQLSKEEAGILELQDDSRMLITNEIQWREAFLYNSGARELPEGDEATDQFDRTWANHGH